MVSWTILPINQLNDIILKICIKIGHVKTCALHLLSLFYPSPALATNSPSPLTHPNPTISLSSSSTIGSTAVVGHAMNISTVPIFDFYSLSLSLSLRRLADQYQSTSTVPLLGLYDLVLGIFNLHT